MTLSLASYVTYTSKCPPDVGVEEWNDIVSIAVTRLLFCLGLTETPTEDGEDVASFNYLLAWFIAFCLRMDKQEDALVTKKSLDDFTVEFQNASVLSAWAEICKRMPDLVLMYRQRACHVPKGRFHPDDFL